VVAEEMAAAPDSGVAIRTIFINASSNLYSALDSADLVIPYDPDSLHGLAETSLKAYWLDETTGSWSLLAFAVDTVKNQITAHTTHFSIFGVFGSGLVRAERLAAVPLTLAMCAYPVPANPAVTISFSLPRESKVELAVYNLRGQKVAQLVRQTMKPGTYKEIWSGAASGVYFAVLKAQGKMLRQKIVLMK
jgi:hypothetical protein